MQLIEAVAVCCRCRGVSFQNPAILPINEKNDVPAIFNQELEAVQGLFGDLAFGDIPDKHQGTIFTFELKGDGIDLHIQMAAVHSHKYLLDGRSGFPFLVYLMNAFANDFMKIRMISVHHGLAKELSRIRGTVSRNGPQGARSWLDRSILRSSKTEDLT